MSSAPRVSGFVLILTLWLSSLPATAQPPAPALREGKPGGVLRRAGQLAWSGGGGWVYLRGDRQDPSALGMLELR